VETEQDQTARDERHDAERMGRRAFLVKGSIVGAGALAAPMLSKLPQAWGAGACHFGSVAQPRNGQSMQQSLLQLESLAGRRFSTVHQRMPWTTKLVNGYSTWAVEGGRTPILSWFARNGNTLIGFKAIANGSHDRWITEQAQALRASGWSGYLCWHKEPEDETNATDWKAAYARVRQIFANVGVTKFKWVVCLIASTYRSGNAGSWIPNAPWDLLGADGNNRASCRNVSWKTFGDVFGAANDFAVVRGKKLYIVEFASVEGASNQKAGWFDDARATIKTWPQLEGVSHLNEKSDCTYWVDTSSSALEGFRRMANDPHFK
jgi:hypothetical protein